MCQLYHSHPFTVQENAKKNLVVYDTSLLPVTDPVLPLPSETMTFVGLEFGLYVSIFC